MSAGCQINIVISLPAELRWTLFKVNLAKGSIMAPRHYPNQCWLLISEVMWHSFEGSVTASAQDTILHSEFENLIFEITTTSPRPSNLNVYFSRHDSSLWHQCTRNFYDKTQTKRVIFYIILYTPYAKFRIQYYDQSSYSQINGTLVNIIIISRNGQVFIWKCVLISHKQRPVVWLTDISQSDISQVLVSTEFELL